MIEPKTLKGFRDFLPAEARKRQYLTNALKEVFELYGFEPLETPALEYDEILTGKYGDEGEKLMYRFVDKGERKVAMRYDQTVPLARVVGQYKNSLPLPFKRYQMQTVWRAENTQKGRFREFLQSDIDTVGVDTALSDAETILVAVRALDRLGFTKFKVLINDRNIFTNLVAKNVATEEKLPAVIRSVDKLKKIGREKVIDEIAARGFSNTEATAALEAVELAEKTERIQEIMNLLKEFGVDEDKYQFEPTLARGLDYYTGLIFEVEVEGYDAGSVLGGGRYNELIGSFSNDPIPAVGFAFGFDRTIEALEALNLFPDAVKVAATKVLVTVFNKESLAYSIETANYLRTNNINTELYENPEDKLDKQLKFADKKGIRFAIIAGPEEIKTKTYTLKDLRTGKQEIVKKEDLKNVLI